MNARFRPLRIATLCSLFLALIFTGVLAASPRKASVAKYGNTAGALAIHKMLNAVDGKGGVHQTLRFPYIEDNAPSFRQAHAGAIAKDSNAPTIEISEAVKTFDVFAPPPSFLPVAGPLTPNNSTPVWSRDETYIVYSSNRTPDGNFHLWAVNSGGGVPKQLTSGPGNEMFPVLSPSNQRLAFTSDAQTPGNQNLYDIKFTDALAASINVTSLTSRTIATPRTPLTGFTQVGRPAWSPAEDRLAFAALTGENGPDDGHFHIYYLYTNSNGYQESVAGPPGKITSGPEDDNDVAWSPDGRYILFSSNADGFNNTGDPILPNPGDPTMEKTPVSAATAGSFTLLYAVDGSLGTVPPSLAPTSGALTAVPSSGGGAWSDINSSMKGYIAFHRPVPNAANDGTQHFEIDYWHAENVTTGDLTTFEAGGGVPLDTSNTKDSNDTYPSWSPLLKHSAITYQSNRSITYNNIDNNNEPLETALTIVPGTHGVGPDYTGILVSALNYVNPPKLLPFTHGEVIHVNAGSAYTPPTVADPTGGATHNITPGGLATFTVRLSDRESGLDDANIYLQFKDPDSLYQDTRIGGAPMEHKVFSNNPGNTSGSVFYLDTLGGNPFMGNNGLFGAIGTAFDGNNLLGVGHTNLGANEGGSNVVGGSKIPGYDPNQFIGWGQEYECQFLNANYYAGNAGQADPTINQYGSPFYLAGVDDEFAHSAPQARPEWLQLTRLPANQQDTNGGVLYSATGGWKAPQSPSDYYIDVIAYDTAQNWRIFDNVWGFTSQQFTGHSGILVVNDYALGQKFKAASLADSGASNVAPTFYGTESYYTDVDTDLLPNSVVIATALKGYPPVPEGLIQPGAGAAPNLLAAYPSYDAGDSATDVVLRWGSPNPLPTTYTIVRRTMPNGPDTTLTVQLPGAATRYVDRSILGGDPKVAGIYTYTVESDGNASSSVTITVAASTDLKTVGTEVLPLGGPRQRFGLVNALQQEPRTFPAAKNALGESSFGATPTGVTFDGFLGYDPYIGYTPKATPDAGHQYDMWRVLSRGPIDPNVLASYTTAPSLQPAVNDNGVKNDPASIPVATKCVLWISPYAGESLVGPGTITDPTTQSQLQSFVGGGGRLFVSGAHVADALTFGGAVNTGPTDFLSAVLGASWTGRSANSQVLASGGGRGNRLTFDPFFNQNLNLGVATPYYVYTTDDNRPYQYAAPSSRPTIIANNLRESFDAGERANARTDGSLDQFGRFSSSVGPFNRDVVGFIDTVTAKANTHNDITYNGSAGLIYQEKAGGGRAIFGSFGLEGLGIDYYRINKNGSDYYLPYNLRPNIVHNIVTYLRTGTYTGQVTDDNGAAVGGATVYLTANEGVAIPGLPAGRTVYSALTEGNGFYRIDGVEQGAYIVNAYKNGYARGQSIHASSVDALATQTVSVVIRKVADGSIAGTVRFADGQPANGAAVTFTAPDGTKIGGFTNADGQYSIQAASAADPGLTYTGFAQKGTSQSTTATVVVASSRLTTQDFTLPPAPSFIAGAVTDSVTTQPLQGVTVTFTITGGTTVAGTTTTAVDGTYTSANLPAGTYDVAFSLSPDYLTGQAPGVQLLEGSTLNESFALVKALPGSISGTVLYEDNTLAGGAIVTFTPVGGGAPVTATTNPDGTYTATPVPSSTEPGKSYNGSATKGFSTINLPTPVVVASGASVPGVNFTLKIPPGKFVGKVVDANGAALSGATVTFTSASGAQTTVTSQPDGSYDSGLLVAGTFKITASLMSNYETTTLPGVVLARDETHTQNITLQIVKPGSITGVVSAPNGLPVPGATVTFIATGQPPLTTTTDANGTYTITPAPTVTNPGRQYTGTASKGAATSTPQTTIVKDNTASTVNFTLTPPPGTFTGSVTDAATSAPIGGALVVFTPLQGADRTAVSTTAKPDGTYTSPSLMFGNYTITASSSPKYFPSTVASVYLADSVSTTQSFQLTKEPNGSIGGLAALSQGTLVGGATITITPSDGSPAITLSSNASATDAGNGAVNYTASVSPGTYTVTMTKAGYVSSSSVVVVVTSGGFQRADLAFSPIATIPGGLRMISAPYDYSGSSLDAVLGVGQPAGSVRIAIWQPDQLSYALNPTPPADALHLGYGYWVRLKSDTSIYFTGALAASATVSVPLHKYWNQIGVPSLTAINVSDLKFTSPTGATLTFDQASAPSVDIVDKTLYSYDPGSNSYQPVTAGGTLSPWQGYWIKVLKNTTVMIPTNVTGAHIAGR